MTGTFACTVCANAPPRAGEPCRLCGRVRGLSEGERLARTVRHIIEGMALGFVAVGGIFLALIIWAVLR